jgi:Domain of unknown function (DUF4333)
MRSRFVRTLGVLALVLAAAACSKTLDTTELEGSLKDQLETQLEVSGLTVECPDDIEAKAGDTFRCTATGTDGSAATVEVTQTDDQGNLTWEIVDAGTG